MTNLYVAYGSNLNLTQMTYICPTAKPYGKGKINDYKLVFNEVATIDKCEGAEVPVGVWEIDAECEKALDRYEGYPWLYRKEQIEVEMYDGEKVDAMVYIMNDCNIKLPQRHYYDIIEQGYDDVGLDKSYLERAYREAEEEDEWFRNFIYSQRWIFAKTFAQFASHEYVVRGKQRGTKDDFDRAERYILSHGLRMFYYTTERRYVYLDGKYYWMTGVGDKDAVINRCKPDDYDVVFMKRGTQAKKLAEKNKKKKVLKQYTLFADDQEDDDN